MHQERVRRTPLSAILSHLCITLITIIILITVIIFIYNLNNRNLNRNIYIGVNLETLALRYDSLHLDILPSHNMSH